MDRRFLMCCLLGTHQLRKTLRPPARAAGNVIGKQCNLYIGSVQASRPGQVVVHQIHQFFMRKFMRFAGGLPQPIAEIQKVIEC